MSTSLLYPASFEEKLGFDQIREILRSHCLSLMGQGWVNKIGFLTDVAEISLLLEQTGEMKQILQFGENFPAQDYYDMVPLLLHLRIQGTHPEPEQLSELKLSLTTIQDLIDFLTSNKEKYPVLYNAVPEEQVSDVNDQLSLPHLLSSIVRRIDALINEKSEIRSTASPTLQKIRREKLAKQAQVERKIVQSFKLARQSGWTPDDADITIRNGRLVIPMINTHKRRIPGFLHDESATGQTVYIEPAEIFETNNEIRELDYAERREIVRILIEFANFIRPEIDSLVTGYLFLGKMDFIRAKARFAIEINATLPASNPRHPCLRQAGSHQASSIPACPAGRQSSSHPAIQHPASFTWHQAIHPLLFLSHRKQKKNIVPLDISLNPAQRILIISGPNAGGKSVCLKTVGLVQYMYQCGLLPPVREDSEFCIFRKIFIDIGDEQSIDNDLSTYTSKLLNLKSFIENIDDQSLFLIDELGTGTDPSLGGAIAEATLEALNARGACGVVTTHYSNLKLLAGREDGIVNGAMLFDSAKLKPLFILKSGKPGSSFALEIAREIGFPKEVLKNARSKTGKSQLDFDRELQNLEVEKQQINRQSTELKVADDFLAELIKKYEKLTTDLEKSKKEILEKAHEEARQLLSDSNKIIEKTIKEIKEAQAEKNATKKVREALTEFKEELGIVHPPSGKMENKPKDQRSKIKPETLNLKPSTFNLKPSSSPYQSYISDLQSKLASFSLTLDLRGERVNEALALLQRYIDDAILLSISEVRILHGKGNGVLRQVTRDYLRSVKEVKKVADENLEHGGAGITVVVFK